MTKRNFFYKIIATTTKRLNLLTKIKFFGLKIVKINKFFKLKILKLSFFELKIVKIIKLIN